MKDWIKHPLILTGELVELIPLEKEHFPELEKIAADKRIWEFYPVDCSVPEKFVKTYNEALEQKANGSHYPMVIIHRAKNKLIGSTRYLDIHPEDKKLEIGWTWLQPEYWGTAINFECKLLLLTHCFETLKANRVQLKTDQNNMRSQKAIEKIGGKFEGILRKDRIRDNGIIRNTAYYSILDEEWETVKKNLTELYQNKKKESNEQYA